MEFIDNANLPEDKVTLLVSSVKVDGIKTLMPPKIFSLKSPLDTHADLGLCHLGGRNVICPPDTFDYYLKELSPYGFNVISGESSLSCTYPNDAAYNIAILKDKVILNSKICDSRLLLEIKKCGFKIIDQNQGYSRCSTAIITENAIITEDNGIYQSALKNGIDALLVKCGVSLFGFKNGFLGGSCGKISKNELFINGNLSVHPDFEKIVNFLASYNVTPIFNNAEKVVDIGSIIPLLTGE